MAITGILGPISLYFIIGLVVALVSKKDPVISAAYAGLLAFILTFIIGEISFYYIGSIPLPRSHFQLAKIILNQIVSLIGAIAISSLGGKLVRKYKA